MSEGDLGGRYGSNQLAIQGSKVVPGRGGDSIGQAGAHVATGEEQGDGQEDSQEVVEVSILGEIV